MSPAGTPREAAYLARYRAQAAHQARIRAAIAELRAVCESLRDWRQTAAQLAAIGGTHARIEWTDSRLQGLAGLRALLVEHQTVRRDTLQAWAELGEAEQVGLSPPATLDAD